MTASLDELRAHLDSPDPAVRRAAMAHIAYRGAETKPLASRVARALVDPHEAVQYDAMGAFRAAGPGARDAVPVLLELLEGAPPGSMLYTRATYCLSVVGVDAREAVPTLLALAQAGGDGGRAVEALAQIADTPSDAVADAVLAACLDPSYTIASATARALERSPEWLARRVLAGAEAALATDRAPGAASALLELASRWPDEVMPIVHRALLARIPNTGVLGLALERVDRPVPVDVALAELERGLEGIDGALRGLARYADRTDIAALLPRAEDALVPRLADGELRWVASGAAALAAIAPGSALGLDVVLGRAAKALRAKEPAVYPAGTLLGAAAKLTNDARLADTVDALEAAKKRSVAIVRKNRSGGLDLQRAIDRALEHLAQRSERAASAAAVRTEADRVEAAHARADAQREEARRRGPAPIPKARAPLGPPTARALLAADRRLLDALRAEARSAGLRAKTPAKVIAWADAEVARRQLDGGHDAAPDVAAVYGDAVGRMLGWEWMRFEQGSLVQLAVVSPKKRHALLPGKLVTRGLAPGADVALALTANMLRDRPPAAKPGALAVLR